MDLANPISAVIPALGGRVLLVLARAGLPMSGLAIAHLADASAEGVRRVLVRLREQGLVSARPSGSSVLYEANRRHLLWPAVQRLAEDADQAVRTVQRIIGDRIAATVPVGDVDRVTAALYGSVARGDSRPDSDVDVLVIFPGSVDDAALHSTEVAVVDAVEVAAGNQCSVYAVRRSRFDELVAESDPMIRSWDADAVVFHGPDFRRRLRGGAWDES